MNNPIALKIFKYLFIENNYSFNFLNVILFFLLKIKIILFFFIFQYKKLLKRFDLGIGDWVLGIGDWVTASDICDHFEEIGTPQKATVLVKRAVEDGRVK